jgi:protein gp37
MTKISWTDKTWNPIVGCSRISEGCKNCYAATVAASARMQQFSQYQAVKNWNGAIALVYNQLEKPLSWRQPQKIFACSMSDLFHENITNVNRDEVFNVIEKCPQHTFQLLTKRPEIAVEYFQYRYKGDLIPDNVWFGVTAENQATADKRINTLKQINSSIKWVSFEPLLEDIWLEDFLGASNYFDWAVVGGESGSNYRPVEVSWIESIVEQCQNAGVPTWVKQDSAFLSGKQGRINDHTWSIKQFPHGN